MVKLYVAGEGGVAVLTVVQDRCTCDVHLDEQKARCIAIDPLRPERLFCGTFGKGLWHSTDAGRNWRPVGEGIAHPKVLSVAVSRNERVNGHGVVYAGTEPSRIFRSEDDGSSWQERPGLLDLPSSTEWSFPPRPETHHVRWIHLDPHRTGYVFAAIEAGALVCSPDSGEHWNDRVAGGPIDTHQLATHLSAPGVLYSAAGDGYFESRDGGQTWTQPDDGLRHKYLWSVGVDSANVENVVVSAAASPRHSHDKQNAESFIYRRRAKSAWQQVRDGLPAPTGRRTALVAAHPHQAGTFFCVWESDVYRSSDGGSSWQRLPVARPQDFPIHESSGLVVAGSE